MKISDIKRDIKNKAKDVVAKWTNDAYQEVLVAIGRYYGSYYPTRYERTGTLERALKKQHGAYTAKIWLDTGLKYARVDMSITGLPSRPWTMSEVIASAENGMHGGRIGGAPSIWQEPESKFEKLLDDAMHAYGFR